MNIDYESNTCNFILLKSQSSQVFNFNEIRIFNQLRALRYYDNPFISEEIEL